MDITCSVCHLKFQNEVVFTEHFVTEHTAITLVPQGITSNSQRENLDNSVEIVPTSQDSRFSSPCSKRCEICGFHSLQPCVLASHILTHIGAMPYFCQLCTFSTISKLHLLHHISSHDHLIKNRSNYVLKSKFNTHECESCIAVFPNWIKLTLHYMQHLKEMPFKCEICRLLFSERKDFIIHNHLHKVILGCDMCQNNFSTRADLLKHVLSHNTSKAFRKFDRADAHKHLIISKPISLQTSFCDPNYLPETNLNNQLSNDFSRKYIFVDGNSPMNSISREDNVSKVSRNYSEHSTLSNVKLQFDCNFKQNSFSNTQSLPKHKLAIKINTNFSKLKVGSKAARKKVSPIYIDTCKKKESRKNTYISNLNKFPQEVRESCTVVEKGIKDVQLDKSSENISPKNCVAKFKLKQLSVLLFRLPSSVQSYRAFCKWNNQSQVMEENCRKLNLLSNRDRNLQVSEFKSLKKISLQDECINLSRGIQNNELTNATNSESFDEFGETTESCDSISSYEDSVENYFTETGDKIQNKVGTCSSFNHPQRHSYANQDNFMNDNQVDNCNQLFVLIDKLPHYVNDMPSFKKFLRISKQKKKFHGKSSQKTQNSDNVKTFVSSIQSITNFKKKQSAYKKLNLKKKNVKKDSSSDKKLNTMSRLSVTKTPKVARKSIKNSNFMFEPSPEFRFKNSLKTYLKQSQKSNHQNSTAKDNLLHISQSKKLFVLLHRLPNIVYEKYLKQKPLMMSIIYPEIVETKSISFDNEFNLNTVKTEHNYCVSSEMC
ncbi:uncharacterized protein TNCT_243781 [Trichonephila clavata]|uniref:C2H2-type domain-containing protein n=1 Tax=Trichonephila clavata TaxID=2740835 RepID=A0A8X6I1M4_TRICU|nr:uncharacterized protein TNCT_243781 [Trichonephila clavata]